MSKHNVYQTMFVKCSLNVNIVIVERSTAGRNEDFQRTRAIVYVLKLSELIDLSPKLGNFRQPLQVTTYGLHNYANLNKVIKSFYPYGETSKFKVTKSNRKCFGFHSVLNKLIGRCV